ncbi:MAG: hypothetical protein ACYSWR_06490 [Planctomycetota bacterium]
MKARKKCLVIAMAVVLAGVALCVNGCKKSGPTAQAAGVELCTGCGQIKGGDLCCKPNQPKCRGCGLVKGSPGCCKIPKGAQAAAICTKCGQIKGSDLCCKPNQVTCAKCGLVKGSPGCCKLPTK